MPSWLLLTATLPTQPSALRVRVWRALKATGAGSLRDGVYVLPAGAPTASALVKLAAVITEAGAPAYLLELDARDTAQEAELRALVDRADAYAELTQAIKQARSGLARASEAELRRTIRVLTQELAGLRGIDFFPGQPADRAEAALASLRRDVETRLSPGEPASRATSKRDPVLERLEPASFQGRTWATRRRPWIDRLATAWLITRHIDRAPRFVWLADPAKCPKSALGFDFDGARFTHVGNLVSFEVVARHFGLDGDPAIRRMGDLVHGLDAGGVLADEGAGVEAIVRGLQARHAKDDALLSAALPVFDALYAAFKPSLKVTA